jgi:alpha-D-xyloside xylohydrolase
MNRYDNVSLLERNVIIGSPKEIIKIVRQDGALEFSVSTGDPTASSSDAFRLLTYTLSSPFPNAISVQMTHRNGKPSPHIDFLGKDRTASMVIKETDDEYQIFSGKTEARIAKVGLFEIAFFHDNKFLTRTGSASALIREDGKSIIRSAHTIDVGEYFYGLGAQSGSFTRNGVRSGSHITPTFYLSETSTPYYLSSKAYGILVNHVDVTRFDFGHSFPGQITFESDYNSLEFIIVAGETTKQTTSFFSDMIGRPSLSPAWSFGTNLSTTAEAAYDESYIYESVEGLLERDINISLLHIDRRWMPNYEWTGFLWDAHRFPDPEDLIRTLHERGIRVCLWIGPYISQQSPFYSEALAANYFLRDANGELIRSDAIQPGAAWIDFTHPAAKGFYLKCLEDLIRIGIDTFCIDDESPDFLENFVRSSSGGIRFSNGHLLNNPSAYYGTLFTQSVFDWLEKRVGKSRTIMFSGHYGIGAQRCPTHVIGHAPADYAGMHDTLSKGLSLSVCGFGTWSHDIGGAENGCNPDLFMRWTQFAALSPHARLHGRQQYKLPWMYGEEAAEVFSHFTRLRHGLMPYIYSLAVEAASTGIPMTRPMYIEFPSDETCANLDRQYMFGDSLLCAPIFSEDGRVRYYVPEGLWTNILTYDRIEGPCWRTEKHDYFTMPLLARDNSALVTGKSDDQAEYDYLEGVTVTLFELHENRPVASEVFAADAQKSGIIRAVRKDNRISVQMDGFRSSCRLMLPHVFDVQSTTDGIPETHDWGTSIVFSGGRLEISL